LLSLNASNVALKVQSWEQDPKLEKVAKLLWDERRLESPTVEDHRRFCREAEEILGPEENLFRIDWVRVALSLSRGHQMY
jgi:paired amphipathic helix protein Sin3a